MEDKRVEDSYKLLVESQKVCKMVDTEGWKEIIQPMVDKMLEDVVGGKRGVKWIPGILQKEKDADRMHYWVGYKQALIDLNNRLWYFVTRRRPLEDKIKSLEEKKLKPDIEPMATSKYRP